MDSCPFGFVIFTSNFNKRKQQRMKKISAYVRPETLSHLSEIVYEEGFGMTVTEIKGCGRQKGHTETFQGREYTVNILPKILVETVVPDGDVEKVVSIITENCKTGYIGDGLITVEPVERAVRIFNGDSDDDALRLSFGDMVNQGSEANDI
jgi:nitrogen regulatory protein P-II 1